MLTQKRLINYYSTDKKELIDCIFKLISEKLFRIEQRILFHRCGIYDDIPMDFDNLSVRLRLGSAKQAEKQYEDAIRKIRDAIPGSPVEKLITYQFV